MRIINNIIISGNFSNMIMNGVEYAPDKFIIKNVLQNKLKCDKIDLDKTNDVLRVYWKKE